MAVTVVTAPGQTTVMSVYRRMEYVVTSNDPFIEKMEASVRIHNSDTFASGVDDTILIHLDPDLGTSNQFTFDIQKICRDALRSYYIGEGNSIIAAPDGDRLNGSLRFINVIFTEYVDNGAGLLVAGASSGNNFTYIINSVFQPTELVATFLMRSAAPARFLTRAPDDEPITFDERRFLDCVLDETPDGATHFTLLSYQVAVERFNTSGVSLGITRNAINLTTAKRFVVSAGPSNLDTIFGGLFTGSEGSYEVWIELGTNARISEKKGYTIDNKCRNQSQRFHWVNRFGGLDSFTFTGETERFFTVERENYVKELPDFDVTDYEQYRGKKVLENRNVPVTTSFSAVLSASQRGLMEDLFTSNLVFTDESSTNYQPIILRGQQIQTINVDFFQIQFEYEAANALISQRG